MGTCWAGVKTPSPIVTNLSYRWDAENRLEGIHYSSWPFFAEWFETNEVTELRYDGWGRLREVTEVSGLAGGGAAQRETVRYIWDGWLLRAELDGQNRIRRTYTWGIDLSGSIGGAGGIGGLLASKDPSSPRTHFYRSDGRGNIVEIRDDLHSLQAEYSYSPFGRIAHQSRAGGRSAV